MRSRIKKKERNEGDEEACDQPNEKSPVELEMLRLLIIDHYPVPLLNNISLDKFKE